MAYLVTGCAGFIGSHLSERLLEQGEEVIGIDCLTPYYDPRIKRHNLENLTRCKNFTWVEEDLLETNLDEWLRKVDCVFHTAAQPGVRLSWGEEFHTYIRQNLLVTQRLLESIKNSGREIRVVFSSSSSVYGNTNQLPMTESAVPQPFSPYGVTKLSSEHLCLAYHANYRIPVVALRYFTVYGPRQRPDMAFHLFCRSILENKPLTILGDGAQTRDFTYVSDIVAANCAAARRPAEGEVFNIGGGSRISLREVVTLLEEITGRAIPVIHQPSAKGDVRDTWASTEKAQRLLDFRPQVSLREGLERQYAWHRDLQTSQRM